MACVISHLKAFGFAFPEEFQEKCFRALRQLQKRKVKTFIDSIIRLYLIII